MTSDEAAEKAWEAWVLSPEPATYRNSFNAGWRARDAEVALERSYSDADTQTAATLASENAILRAENRRSYALQVAQADEIQALREQLAVAEATLARVRAARSDYPACDKYPDDGGPVLCGWRRAVLDIDAALNGKGEGDD